MAYKWGFKEHVASHHCSPVNAVMKNEGGELHEHPLELIMNPGQRTTCSQARGETLWKVQRLGVEPKSKDMAVITPTSAASRGDGKDIV